MTMGRGATGSGPHRARDNRRENHRLAPDPRKPPPVLQAAPGYTKKGLYFRSFSTVVIGPWPGAITVEPGNASRMRRACCNSCGQEK